MYPYMEIQGSTAVVTFLVVIHYITREIKCSWKKDDNAAIFRPNKLWYKHDTV
jgi:hypothetical protein